MSKIEDADRFYDLLFEVSNDTRHNILLFLKVQPQRVSQITKQLNLIGPETSRHLQRLSVSRLIRKDMENRYHVTNYGEYIISMIDDLEFIVKNRDYFVPHNPTLIPSIYQKRLSELVPYTPEDNFMNFLDFMNKKIKEAKDFIWLSLNQYPIISMKELLNAVERNVKIRIIEQGELIGPNVAFDQKHLQSDNSESPRVEIKIHPNTDVYLFISDAGSAVAFPIETKYDYTGFINHNLENETWSIDVFNHYWTEAKPKTLLPLQKLKKIPQKTGKLITITPQPTPDLNYQAIQNAVNTYDEVKLHGSFNLGSYSITIKKSVKIRGEGRNKDIPETKIYKTGWKFPSREHGVTFGIDQEGVDVSIENIHFQDFNGYCIANAEGNSVTIKNNHFTLATGLGRGWTYGQEGDCVTAIMAGGGYRDRCGFPGGILIKGNYIDFAVSYVRGGQVSRKRLDDPLYRPDLRNHESYIGYGIELNRNLGKVIVQDNVIRNVNARSICVSDNCESAEINIQGNSIISDVYGAYPYESEIAGMGIKVQSAWSIPRSGSRVKIVKNKIRCNKVNFCGIAVYGPDLYREGAGKIESCLVENNTIHLEDGSVGILVRKADNTKIIENQISGKAYYGVHFHGSEDLEGLNLMSNENILERNNLSNLVIKSQDEYSVLYLGQEKIGHSDQGTAHVLLNKHSSHNTIKVQSNEKVINEGKNNSIIVDTIEKQ